MTGRRLADSVEIEYFPDCQVWEDFGRLPLTCSGNIPRSRGWSSSDRWCETTVCLAVPWFYR